MCLTSPPLQEITDQLVSAVLGGKKSFSYPRCCHKYTASPGCIIGKNIKKKIALPASQITCRVIFSCDLLREVCEVFRLKNKLVATSSDIYLSPLALWLICMGAIINVDNCRKLEFIHSGSVNGQV